MALSNHERVGKALDLLKDGLAPFVERELKATYAQQWLDQARDAAGPTQSRLFKDETRVQWDAWALLSVMWNQWNLVFRKTLGPAERSLVSELKDARNNWAHQRPFSSDDTYRALDSASRLLTAVSASQADDIEKMKNELLRVRFEEQLRTEKRKSAGTAIESQAASTLTPWREVVMPHRDVASGRYQQAEFAADLWQVHIGEGSDEYRHPTEFFRRTYLTTSLQHLLVGAVRRLSGQQGDPVVQLQTNFGGGKTHSMLALYHLFSGVTPGDLPGMDALMAEAGVAALPTARRVVLVGNKISPGNPVIKPDGTVVHTIWGELAWQLGGRPAYEQVRQDDERATSPGDRLRELFNEYGPCLVLIDEWVAYARQLHDQSDLPGGSFETHFSFAQALTESAKLAEKCLLVISLPASDTTGSPHAVAEDVEVGGERGRAALDRLRHAVGRVEASWRPASAEEGFEIVRRRLFEPMTEKRQFVARDAVARAFVDLYRDEKHTHDFPHECRNPDYELRIKAAYPIHPEVFDRLYNDWSTLVKFQRTRGVLRLMAAVIHSLWEKGDRNPLILPANIAIDDQRVQFELTRYLSDNWTPVIAKDVDGPHALPLRIDAQFTNLGKYAACRRVARAIYLGSAPTQAAANRGIEDRRVKLGSVMPGESPATFGDALRRLSVEATYLYTDSNRYWYSTQPTVTKMAEDRAERLARDPDKVVEEIDRRLRENLKTRGDFVGTHPLPKGGQDVADEPEARLVVLGVEYPYSKETDNKAETAAKAILESRGAGPRMYLNSLVFLAVDKARLQELDEGVRRYLAWQSIVGEKTALNLTPHQVSQADQQLKGADGTVTARLPEAYNWLLVPIQATPQAPVTWQATRLTGQDALAARASKRLRSDEQLILVLGATRLRMELDRVPLWRGDHVTVQQLMEDFGRYLYLPRLRDSSVLLGAVAKGVELLTWTSDGFAYAEGFDDENNRYRALRTGQLVDVSPQNTSGMLVRPERAQAQLDAEAAERDKAVVTPGGGSVTPDLSGGTGPCPVDLGPVKRVVRRFHGTVALDSSRAGRDAGKIAEEVIAHLEGLVGTSVSVTLEIEANAPNGFPENVVRTVTENARVLKFEPHTAFESE